MSFLAASILLEILFLLALIRSSCFSWLMSHKVEDGSGSPPLEEVDGIVRCLRRIVYNSLEKISADSLSFWRITCVTSVSQYSSVGYEPSNAFVIANGREELESQV